MHFLTILALLNFTQKISLNSSNILLAKKYFLDRITPGQSEVLVFFYFYHLKFNFLKKKLQKNDKIYGKWNKMEYFALPK